MAKLKKLPVRVDKKPNYQDTDISDYQGNPLILALPPRLEPKRFRFYLSNVVDTFNWQSMSNNDREEQVKDIRKTRIVTTQHLDLYHSIYEMMRYGYVHRNPVIPEVTTWNYDIGNPNIPIEEIDKPSLNIVTQPTVADAIFLSGFSGNGKSTISEHILVNLFPTAIEHTWRGFTEVQVVYLKVDLPHNASRPGLIYRFLKELDRVLSKTKYGNPNYAKSVKLNSGRYIDVDSMMDILMTVLVRHHVGLLVTDEFQNLQVSSHRYRNETIQMFDELANNLYIPSVKIGTPDTILIFDRNSRHKRRLGQIIELLHLSDEKSWERAMKALFQFQPLKHPVDRNVAIENLLMELTAGVPNYLIGLWEASILEAIRSGKEKLSQTLIKRAFNQRFPLLRSVTRNINQGIKGRHADLFTVQQYLDMGNNTMAIKHLHSFSKNVDVTGVAAEAVISDIETMVSRHGFSDSQLKGINEVKERLIRKKAELNAPQTLEHKP